MALMSRCSFWSDDVWLVVLLLLMFDSEMLTSGHSPLIDDDFVRWQFRPDTYFPGFILHWELTHFEMMHSYWGRTYLADFDIETPLPVYDRCSRWIIVIGTLGSIFSTYLVRLGYPLSFVTYLYILHWTLLYLHSSYQSLTSFEPTYFTILHDLILLSWSEEDMD